MKTGKIKKHFSDNKNVYIACGAGVAVGVIGTLIFKNASINLRQTQILTWKSKQVMEVYIEALGDPGNIVQDTTTGIIYASQGQAARSIGVSASTMSKHIAGLIPDVKGHVFDKLGKAMVAP